MNKKALIIPIILALAVSIAIILGAVFYSAKNRAREEENQPPTAVTAPDISEEIDISHWETYRNEEFGFEFKHPSEADGWIYRSPAYRKFTDIELEAYKLESRKHKSDQWVYQTKDDPIGPYDVFGSGIQFEGDWSILVTVMPKKINDLLIDKNYGMRKYWDIENREKIVLENGLKGEKVTWANGAIHFYVQKDDFPLTIEFSGYSDLSAAAKEEKNNQHIMYEYNMHNTILLKIISSLKFTGN